MKLMVSYQRYRGDCPSYSDCGNQTFDSVNEALKYISENRLKWKSFTVFRYGQETLPGVYDLIPVDIGQFT